MRFTGGQEAQHAPHHREGRRRSPAIRREAIRVAGAVPEDRPRATGDRSPRGRVAGVDAGLYLLGDTQSVNDSSP